MKMTRNPFNVSADSGAIDMSEADALYARLSAHLADMAQATFKVGDAVKFRYGASDLPADRGPNSSDGDQARGHGVILELDTSLDRATIQLAEVTPDGKLSMLHQKLMRPISDLEPTNMQLVGGAPSVHTSSRSARTAGLLDMSIEQQENLSTDEFLRCWQEERDGTAKARRAESNALALRQQQEDYWRGVWKRGGGPIPRDFDYLIPKWEREGR